MYYMVIVDVTERCPIIVIEVYASYCTTRARECANYMHTPSWQTPICQSFI